MQSRSLPAKSLKIPHLTVTRGFRGQITDYVRLYAFLAQVLTFADADLAFETPGGEDVLVALGVPPRVSLPHSRRPARDVERPNVA